MLTNVHITQKAKATIIQTLHTSAVAATINSILKNIKDDCVIRVHVVLNIVNALLPYLSTVD